MLFLMYKSYSDIIYGCIPEYLEDSITEYIKKYNNFYKLYIKIENFGGDILNFSNYNNYDKLEHVINNSYKEGEIHDYRILEFYGFV